VLVCVSGHPGCAALVGYAHRLSERLGARWTAIHVETPWHRSVDESAQDRVAECLRLAGQLGGDALTLPGGRAADEILAYAQQNGVTHIVAGKFKPVRWSDRLHRSIGRALARKAGGIALHVVAEEDGGASSFPQTAIPTASRGKAFDPRPYLISIGILALATALGDALRQYLKLTEVALTYLTLVLMTAARFGLMPSLVLSVLSMLAFDFFWVPPIYTWDIDDPRDWMVLLVMVVVAIVTSWLTAWTRAQMVLARRHAKTTAGLYSFSRRLAAIGDLAPLLQAVAHQAGAMLQARVVVLVPEAGRLIEGASHALQAPLDEAEIAVATRAWQSERPSGRGEGPIACPWLFLPLRTLRGVVAVLGIARDPPHMVFTPDERRLLDALADQTAMAMERIALAAELDETRVLRETERLRGALLTSISHDLRTPLASIIGALAILRGEETAQDSDLHAELLDTAQEEAERLNRFVANLLDITRLEGGALEVKREPVDLADVIGAATSRARKCLAGRRVEIDLDEDLPIVQLDFVLFEHVLFNLLDNAAKYAPAESTVSIRAARSDQSVVLQIVDEGSGIPPEDLERIFDKFYRLKASDRQRAGTGLGLGICRGFVAAHGGTIRAGNRSDGAGAVFTITLPVDAEAVAVSAWQDASEKRAQIDRLRVVAQVTTQGRRPATST
jgi:two-component system, OmpR family, sensor histidine kinase KdpD